jgi:hypothetical protein
MKFKLFLFCLFFSINCIAQSSDDTAKRQKYEQLTQEIVNLEMQAQYSGDDQTIRDRLKLPAKLPPFDQWVIKNNFTDVLPKEELKVESVAPEVVLPSKIVQSSQVETPTLSQVVESKSSLIVHSNSRYALFLFLPSILLLLNFIFYRKNPKLRPFLIAPPFGLGESSSEAISETNSNTKTKRLLIEFFLLTTSIAIFCVPFLLSNEFIINPTEISELLLRSLAVYFFGHFIFIAGKLYAGYATKCPKCNSTFARKHLSSYDEPKSTYNHKISPTSQTDHHEVGLTHHEWTCTVCSNQWHSADKYDRIVNRTH